MSVIMNELTEEQPGCKGFVDDTCARLALGVYIKENIERANSYCHVHPCGGGVTEPIPQKDSRKEERA